MSILVNPYALAPPPAAATLEYVALKAGSSGQGGTDISFGVCDIGLPAPGRYVFASLCWQHRFSRSIVGVSIGGVAGKIHVNEQHTTSGDSRRRVAIVSAPLDAGTTAEVVLTLTSGDDVNLVRCGTYRVLGLVSDTPVDTNSRVVSSSASGDNFNCNVDVEAGGFVIACLHNHDGKSATFSAGVDMDFNTKLLAGSNFYYGGGGSETESDQEDYTVTTAFGGGAAAIVAASFR